MGIVGRLDRTGSLEDDVSVVELLVHIVDGDARLLVAATHHVLVHLVTIHTLATMQWDKGWVDVDDGTWISIDQIFWDKQQITSQYDKVNLIVAQHGEDVSFVLHLRLGDEERRNSQTLGSFKDKCIRLVADY